MTVAEPKETLDTIRPDEAHRLNLRSLAPLLRSAPQYQGLLQSLTRSGSRSRAQVLSDSVPFLVCSLLEDLKVPAVIVVPRPEEARRLHERLSAWVSEPQRVHQFPETETLPFERLFTDIETVQQRICALDALLADSGPSACSRTLGYFHRAADVGQAVFRDHCPHARHR